MNSSDSEYVWTWILTIIFAIVVAEKLHATSVSQYKFIFVWTWILTIIFAIVVAEKLHATSVSQYKFIFVVALIEKFNKIS